MPRVIAPVLVFASLGFAQTTGSVTGVVVDRVTGAGIPGTVVVVYLRSQGLTYEATTDGSGDFRIFGMKPGDYEIRFEKSGYDITANRIPPQPYKVGQGQDPVRIRLELTRHVSFSGRVLDPEDNAISQGAVRLGNFKVPVSADGTFTVTDLVPGSYTLTAIPNTTRVPEGARVPVTTTFPESVVIRGDADVSGYEIRLQTAEVYRVSGVVLDESGNPKSKVLVQLMPRLQSGPRIVTMGDFMTFVGPGPSLGPLEERVVSAQDGSFEFPAVRSGEWQVATGVSGQIDSNTFIDTFHSGAATVLVGNRSIENVRIRQGVPFKITGTVDWGDVPSRRAVITLTPVDGRSAAVSRGAIDPNGTFSIDPITPGKSLIVPQSGLGYYPVSVLLGGQEVLGQPVDLIAGLPLRVAYKSAAGSIHGTVDTCNGAAVVLIPKDVRTLAFGRTVPCKSDGTFEMNGVAPGDYYLAALPGFQIDDPRDPKWLARIASIGTSVSVVQGSVSLQLRAVPYLDSK